MLQGDPAPSLWREIGCAGASRRVDWFVKGAIGVIFERFATSLIDRNCRKVSQKNGK